MIEAILGLLGALGATIAALLLAVGRGGSLKRERDTARADYDTLRRINKATTDVPPTADPDNDRRAVRDLAERLRRGRE